MMRPRMFLTVDAPPGHGALRLFDALRDMGYTVNISTGVPGTRRVSAEVLPPHGEVDGGPAYLGKGRCRRIP